MPRAEGGVEPPGVVDAEIGEPRPDAGLVHDAVAEMAGGQLDVRLEGRLDERRVGVRPADSRERADMPALDEPEPAGAAGDLRELHGSRSRRASPSNFVVSAKSRVSHGRLTPWPSTSVATVTSERPSRKRSISSRRELSGIAP